MRDREFDTLERHAPCWGCGTQSGSCPSTCAAPEWPSGDGEALPVHKYVGKGDELRLHLALAHEQPHREGTKGLRALHQLLHRKGADHRHVAPPRQAKSRSLTPLQRSYLKIISDNPGTTKAAAIRKQVPNARGGRIISRYQTLNTLEDKGYIEDRKIFTHACSLHITVKGRKALGLIGSMSSTHDSED